MNMCLYLCSLLSSLCVHIISFDGNLVCFCLVYTLLSQERRTRLGEQPVWMDWHMAFHASSADMHFILFVSFFCAYM